MSEPACCARCGTPAQQGPDGRPVVPWTWSTAQDATDPSQPTRTLLCERCTREHARSIEAKLGSDWW